MLIFDDPLAKRLCVRHPIGLSSSIPSRRSYPPPKNCTTKDNKCDRQSNIVPGIVQTVVIIIRHHPPEISTNDSSAHINPR